MIDPGQSRRPTGRRRAVVRFVALWIVAGLAAGALWAALTPAVEARAESYEAIVAGDVTLAVIAAAAGLGAGGVGLLRTGQASTARFIKAVLGSMAASVVAWGTGRLLGAPTLTMPVVLLLWPLSIAVVTVLGTLVTTLTTRDSY
jgi:hypothetical protein